jgi:hypothetical protein
MGGDFFEILFVLAFILFGILGGRKKKPNATQTGGARPRPPIRGRPSPPRSPTGRRPQSTQDALLRELEGLLTGRRPTDQPPWSPVPGHQVPDPAEARSLETLDAEETDTWEEGLRRASEVQETSRWMAGQERPAASLETLQGAGKPEHDRFHDLYDVASRPPTSSAHRPTFDLQDVRRAVIWSEILGTPVSMR